LKARTVRGIQFRELFPVKPEVHARFSATERSYVYRISQERNPFQDGLVLFMKRFPDVDLMNQAAGYLIGKHDFECFSKSNSQVNSYICDVRSAEWVVHNTLLEFRISADRFLRNMVRAIVGTMLEIGEKKRSPEWMEEVISSGKRSEAGSSAEACGLYLTRVVYPNNIEL
jgi:tRNA pseudouridine38-40 synthase